MISAEDEGMIHNPELTAARNLPSRPDGISESAGDGESGGDAKGSIIPPLKLNLGSGQRPFEIPWINVDCQEKWAWEGKPLTPIQAINWYVRADIRSMPMFKDETAEIIVIWHVCEHFGCGEANPVIQECYRILQPGGTLIVATPDIRALAIGYLTGRIGEQIYLTNLYGAYMADEADRHKWNFSQDGLIAWLSSIASWKSVEKWTGPRPDKTDICTDWWMATAKAIK